MNALHRKLSHLTPFACALSLAIALPAAVQAQASSSAPAAGEASAAKDLPLTAEARRQFVGTYLLSMPGSAGRTMPFRVYEEQGVLYGQPQGGSAKRLLYQGDNKFRPEGENEPTVTFTVEGGQATRFSVATPQGTIEGVRESKTGQS